MVCNIFFVKTLPQCQSVGSLPTDPTVAYDLQRTVMSLDPSLSDFVRHPRRRKCRKASDDISAWEQLGRAEMDGANDIHDAILRYELFKLVWKGVFG